ncbi:MAG: hypothetical protein ACD_82C00134G0001, partial [uncultured bacterium]
MIDDKDGILNAINEVTDKSKENNAKIQALRDESKLLPKKIDDKQKMLNQYDEDFINFQKNIKIMKEGVANYQPF